MTPQVDRSQSWLSATIEALWYGPPPREGTTLISDAAQTSVHSGLIRVLLFLSLLPFTLLTALISRHRFGQIQTAKKARREQWSRVGQGARHPAPNGPSGPSGPGAPVALAIPTATPMAKPPPTPPVVIVGNLLAGGTGKTPIVIALALALKARGWKTGLIARGVGASLPASKAQAFLKPPDFRIAGDEAALMARQASCPIAIGRQRAQALQSLVMAAPSTEIVISDDGLQHRGLSRDLELIVFDQRGLGNGHLLPAGPLREPAFHGLKSDAVLLRDDALDPIGHPVHFAVATQIRGWWSFNAPDKLLSDAAVLEWTRGRRTTVVTGIARPERFFDRLKAIGLEFRAIALADHAPIDPIWLRDLPADCILMTEKDAVKCEESADPRIRVLRIETVIPPSLIDFIEERLFGRPTA